jgi:ribonucleotide reductase beta subunit family protein with ferritin-like domain
MNPSEFAFLEEHESRFSNSKDKFWQMLEHYKSQRRSFWTEEEIDLSQDKIDWDQKLSPDDRHFIKMVLAFFATADGIVNENIAVNLYVAIPSASVRAFYAAQMFFETIHAETYKLLLDTYVSDLDEKNTLFDAIHKVPVIKAKADWALKYIRNDSSFGSKLIAFLCMEGIFFSGAFCSIFWLKQRGLMPGLTFSNELISRDESLHTIGAFTLFELLRAHIQMSDEDIYQIVREAVELEERFVCEALQVSLIGMNSVLMNQYIQFVADFTLSKLGLAKIYLVENPFPWMELVSLRGRTNFFEKRVGEYAKSGVGVESTQQVISFDEDF